MGGEGEEWEAAATVVRRLLAASGWQKLPKSVCRMIPRDVTRGALNACARARDTAPSTTGPLARAMHSTNRSHIPSGPIPLPMSTICPNIALPAPSTAEFGRGLLRPPRAAPAPCATCASVCENLRNNLWGLGSFRLHETN